MPIKIIFTHKSAVFRPGDVVTGHVLVVAQDTSLSDGIELEWQGRVRLTNKNNQVGTYVIFRTAQLLKHSDEGTEADDRAVRIPFKHRLPAPIPPSYVGNTPYGEIRYSVEATLKRSWDEGTVAISTEKEFNVTTVHELIPPHLEQINMNHRVRAKMCCCCLFPTIEIGLALNRRGYSPGEDIAINMAVVNDSGNEIIGVNLKLLRLTSIVCPAGYSYQRSVVYELDLRETIIPSSRTPYALPMKLIPLPATLPTYDTGNDIMCIKYEIQCIICLPQFYDDVVMSLPVIVGTYPAELTSILRKMSILPKEGTALYPLPSADLDSPAFATSIEKVAPTSSLDNLHSTSHDNWHNDSDNSDASDGDDNSVAGMHNLGYQASSTSDMNAYTNSNTKTRRKAPKTMMFEKLSENSWMVRYARSGFILQKSQSPSESAIA